MLDFLGRGPSRPQRPSISRLDVLDHKSRWLRDLISEGAQIVDLGPSPTSVHFPLPSSVFRVQENLELAGYANHVTRLEFTYQGHQRIDKGDYVPPTTSARLGTGAYVDFAKLEHDKMILVLAQILNSVVLRDLSELDPFDLITDNSSLQFVDPSFDALVSDLLECLTSLGSVCDKGTQIRIGPVQQVLRLCKYRFYARIELEAVCERLNGTKIESQGSNIRLVGLEKSILSKRMSPEEYWQAMLRQYRKHAGSMIDPLNEMISERRPITTPSKAVSCEAWITYSLYWQESESPVPLELVLASADFANVIEPQTEELAWTFVKLRKRGWLLHSGASFGLTTQGRSAIDEIVRGRSFQEGIKMIEAWVSSHPSRLA